MRTLFLQAPSFDGFDGGAGSRYQARREIASFWYPTWLAQPAALIEGSKLIDAPPHRTSLAEVTAQARNFDLAVLHTSTPSFKSDVKTIEALKAANPNLKAGLIGAKVAVDAAGSLAAAPVVDFVARNEFDFTIKDVADGMDWKAIRGLSFRDREGTIVHNADRAMIEQMDSLPFVTPIYKRDLTIKNYFVGYLKHPYISLYTGRGCKSRCTFCLWPQTVGGHRYRTRSVGHVLEEIAWAQKAFPEVKEFFFDDDTFTDDLPRAMEIARGLGRLGVTWSCNAKANVPREALKVMRDSGLRLLLVGYESGNQQILHNIKKGMRIDVAERFTKDCHELGVTIHGTFIMGLPGESKETIEETIRFAKRINPHTIQVSLAAPYPGTFLYKQAIEEGWLDDANAELVDEHGVQIAPLHYPGLSHAEIFDSVETFYRQFYFRAGKIASIVGEMVRSPEMMKRRLREGVEFFHFLRERQDAAHKAAS
ncbi:hopanoid biosynthesis associated radical SAM protein HpnJ [Labrys monachus]|nr:hopanoid biosynthesis associated radical SAM protein HpnJ [Labrys monachus]